MPFFTDQEHREAVKKALASHRVESILLIGTSTKMTNSIAKQLELGAIEHYYDVEDIRSFKDIQKSSFYSTNTREACYADPLPTS
ncbi:hypothetical protein OL548_21760 [Lysinibacillus sp. MHQ-1]|nr:hypothetical protein OL548_21760 [Lysinibacillus sp. MHQ-1]